MKAAEFYERCRIRVVETAEPAWPKPGDGTVLFRPELACLCGSDLPFFDSEFEGHAISYPQPIGMSLHEMIGTIEATGSTRWRSGQRVLAVPVGQRGFFERYVLSEDRLVALDARLSDEAALLAQPLGTVIHALKKLPNLIDQDVAVLGLGPIGQMFAACLSNLGARRIVGIDPVPERCALARTSGATDVICGPGASAEERLRAACGGTLPQVVIEAVGHRSEQLNESIALAAEEGVVLYFGVPPETLDGVQWKAAMLKNLVLQTSLHPNFERTFPLAMQWLAEKRIDLSHLRTHRFDLKEIESAFSLFRNRQHGVSKVLVDLSWGE